VQKNHRQEKPSRTEAELEMNGGRADRHETDMTAGLEMSGLGVPGSRVSSPSGQLLTELSYTYSMEPTACRIVSGLPAHLGQTS